MESDINGHSLHTGLSAHVASCVIRVSDLSRSLAFYRDVFCCRVAVREDDMALLLAPNGFQLYLHARTSFHRRPAGTLGCQYLMWATDTESDLQQMEDRMRAYDSAAYTHTDYGITFLECADPDGARIIVAHPSPHQLPRTVIVERLRG